MKTMQTTYLCFWNRVSTGLIEGIHSFQPNRQKSPWYWKDWVLHEIEFIEITGCFQ